MDLYVISVSSKINEFQEGNSMLLILDNPDIWMIMEDVNEALRLVDENYSDFSDGGSYKYLTITRHKTNKLPSEDVSFSYDKDTKELKMNGYSKLFEYINGKWINIDKIINVENNESDGK